MNGSQQSIAFDDRRWPLPKGHGCFINATKLRFTGRGGCRLSRHRAATGFAIAPVPAAPAPARASPPSTSLPRRRRRLAMCHAGMLALAPAYKKEPAGFTRRARPLRAIVTGSTNHPRFADGDAAGCQLWRGAQQFAHAQETGRLAPLYTQRRGCTVGHIVGVGRKTRRHLKRVAAHPSAAILHKLCTDAYRQTTVPAAQYRQHGRYGGLPALPARLPILHPAARPLPLRRIPKHTGQCHRTCRIGSLGIRSSQYCKGAYP